MKLVKLSNDVHGAAEGTYLESQKILNELKIIIQEKLRIAKQAVNY